MRQWILLRLLIQKFSVSSNPSGKKTKKKKKVRAEHKAMLVMGLVEILIWGFQNASSLNVSSSYQCASYETWPVFLLWLGCKAKIKEQRWIHLENKIHDKKTGATFHVASCERKTVSSKPNLTVVVSSKSFCYVSSFEGRDSMQRSFAPLCLKVILEMGSKLHSRTF